MCTANPASRIGTRRQAGASILLAACLLLGLAPASRADEAGWKRAITAGEAAYRNGDYAEAGFAFGTALKNAESFGEGDTRIATSLGWLAETYRLQGRLAEAEPLLKRALAIRERVLGPSHPSTHLTRHNLAVLQKALLESPAPATATAPATPSARQAELAPLKEAARPVEIALSRPKDPAPAPPVPAPIAEAKPKPAPPPVVAEPKPEPPPPPAEVAAPKPKPAPAAAEIAAPKPKPQPAPVEIVAPKPIAPPPAPVVEAKPVPVPVVVERKPEPPAPPVEIAAPKPKPQPAPVEIVAPKPIAPPPAPVVEAKPAPAPVVVERKPEPPAPPVEIVAAKPKPQPVPVEVVAPKPVAPPPAAKPPEPAPTPFAGLLQLFERKPEGESRATPPAEPKPTPAAPSIEPVESKPAPAPQPVEVVIPKPNPPAPPIEMVELKPAAPLAPSPAPVAPRSVEPMAKAAPPPAPASARIVEPVAKPAPPPAPVVAASPREPVRPAEPSKPADPPAVAIVTPKPIPSIAAVAPAIASSPPAPAAPPAPPTERSRLGAQLASLGTASRAGAGSGFEMIQRARETSTVLALPQAQALLQPDEAMLSFLVGENSSYLVAARRDKAELYALDIGRTQLGASVKRLRAQLDPAGDLGIRGRVPDFPVDVAHQLYRSLIGPAASMLDGATHLIVVPDEALQSLPFSVLVTEPFGGPPREGPDAPRPAWLARRYAVTVLPAETSLQLVRAGARRSAASRPFTGFGDPQLRGDSRTLATAASLFGRNAQADVVAVRQMPRLVDSRYVLDAMADILNAEPGEVHVESEATEDAVKRTRLADYRVLGFGTYGLMAGEFPGRSEPGLVLTPPRFGSEEDDGLLTASEVSRLKLDADLVVVTASSTAAADGTPGVEGLPRLSGAFLAAGSRSLMVSHWVVNADSTLKLVSRMLRERARGAGNSEALRRAMLALMNGEDRAAYTHPMYWAQFVLVGEGAGASVQAPSISGGTNTRQ